MIIHKVIHEETLRCTKVFLVLSLAFLSVISGAYGETLLTISNISLDRKTFYPDKDAGVKISYQISKDASVTVKIYDNRDILVKSLKNKVKTGLNVSEWDGRNEKGEQLTGVYIYTIEAESADGEKKKYDPADETGGILLTVRKPVLDTEKGEISYVMPKAGMVRIRAGIKEGALLKTLIDWEPREGGSNVEKWDGKDKSGLIDLFKIPEREVFIFAYSLPDNCIILKSDSNLQKGNESAPSLAEYRLKAKIDSKTKYKHALHDKSVCHEPEFKVEFPKAVSEMPDGTPVVNGNEPVPVKVTISEKDRLHVESARFEVMFFADTVFIFEDEEGFTPFTYMWDTKGLPEGEHVFTVNIMSYDDHCGVESKKVIITMK